MRWVCLFLILFSRVDAVLETMQLDVYLGGMIADTPYARSSPSYTLLASQAFFGTYPKMMNTMNPIQTLALPPEDDRLLCDNRTKNDRLFAPESNVLLLVPRGDCTFEAKTFNAQQLGAKAVAIYGTLASRYSINTTSRGQDYDYTESDVVFPREFYDYDCSNGRADVPAGALDFSPLPYNSDRNDPLLMGNTSTNLCLSLSSEALSRCPSLACLLTGRRSNSTVNDGATTVSYVEACCCWDFSMWLSTDMANRSVSIPAVYLTMNQGSRLLQDFAQFATVHVVLSARWRSAVDVSSLVIWVVGVSVASLAAFLSAHGYHSAIQKARRRRPMRRSNATTRQEQRGTTEAPASVRHDESVELTAFHAIVFLIMASTALLTLFFLKIYNVVKALYALGCAEAFSQVVVDPIVRRVMARFRLRNPVVFRSVADFENVSVRDVVSHLLGHVLGISWLLVAFTNAHPEEVPFFWVVQNVFGACMCIVFLQVIKVNSLKVAVFLLGGAFVYDIFFVFVSPFFFKESVMITVATSGGPPTADPAWCERYPTDKGCLGGQPLPMLFTIPRMFDYQGGSSLLGLGDIVIPGLLLSFAARFDAAKSLLVILGGGNGRLQAVPCPEKGGCGRCRLCASGYYPLVAFSYAVGLFMANAAVYLMRMGQPALLYIVPCTLATMIFLGWRRRELDDLWEGPVAIRTADDILFGQQAPDNSGRQPIVQDDEAREIDLVEDNTRLLA